MIARYNGYMEQSPNELTNPEREYFLDELGGVLNGESSKKPLDVLHEQTTKFLQQGATSDKAEASTVDLDLDAQMQEVVTGIDRGQYRQAESAPTLQRPRRVHMFEYAVKRPTQKPEVMPGEPQFKSVEDAILNTLSSAKLFKDEVVSTVLGLRDKNKIVHDNPITRSSVGASVLNLIAKKILVYDKEGKLTVVRVAGGSTHDSGDIGHDSLLQEEVISGELPYPEGFVPEPPPVVGGVSSMFVNDSASFFQQSQKAAEPKPIVKAEVNHHVITVEDLNRRAEEARSAQRAIEDAKKVASVPDAPMFPPQKPKAVPIPRPIVPAEVSHRVITLEELNRRAEEARNADQEKLAAEKTDEEKTALIEGAQNFDELYEALHLCKAIRGSQGRIYTAEELILKIEEARKALYVLSFNALNSDITRTHELRGKVKELWTIEHTRKTAQATESKEHQFDPKELVGHAENVDQLCEAILTLGQTVGHFEYDGKKLTAEQIVGRIKKGGRFTALDIPLEYGIRAKYRDLAQVEENSLSSVEEEKEVEPPPVYVPDIHPTVDLYDEPIGPVRKEDLSPEESEKIEREMRESLGVAREKFATHEAAYKTKVREGKKMFSSLMAKLGAPGRQRPATEREVEHIEAEKAYMEAKWNLKNFISGRNIKEVEFSHADSLLGLDHVENKKIDVGVLEQAEKEYRLLQDRMLEMTPEKERSTVEKAFQKWNSLPLEYRVGLSAALLTAGGVALGTIGVSGALAALGWRAGRALVGTNIGLAAGRLYGNAKEKEVNEKRAERLDEYGSTKTLEKEQFIAEEKELEKFFDQEKSEIKKNQIKKGLVTAAVAGVSTVGLGMGGQAVMGESVPGGAKVSGNIDSAPKPKIVDTNTTSTKSWFDKIFSDNERVVSKPTTLETSAVPQKVDVPFELKGYEPVGVKLSSDGFIDTVSKLKVRLQGHSVSPAVEKLLAQSPEKIAMDLGLYKPGQVAESGFGLQGEELTMNINGDITLMHNDGSVNILFDASGKAHQFGEYAGNTMFDADHAPASPLPKDVPSVKAPVAVETGVKSASLTPEVGISADHPLASAVMDSGTVGLSLAEAPTPKTINFNQIVAPSAEYAGPQDMVAGKLPLKPEYQFDPKFKAERTAYNVRLEKELMNIPQDMFDLRYPIEYNGGRINVFQKGENIIILLNGQKIGTGQIIDGQPGLQYEASLGKGMLGVKSDFEQAFEKARTEIEKNKMFFKVKK